MFRQPAAWPTARTAPLPVGPNHPVGSVVIRRRIPRTGRTVESVAQVLEVLDYLTGEDDGFITARVALSDRSQRTVQILLEDVRISATPLDAGSQARAWFNRKHNVEEVA